MGSLLRQTRCKIENTVSGQEGGLVSYEAKSKRGVMRVDNKWGTSSMLCYLNLEDVSLSIEAEQRLDEYFKHFNDGYVTDGAATYGGSGSEHNTDPDAKRCPHATVFWASKIPKK